MISTKPRADADVANPPAPAPDALQDALKDALIPASAIKRREVVAGPKPNLTATRGDTGGGDETGDTYIPYPKGADRVVRGTTKHEHSLNHWSDGSALVVNSTDKRHNTSDAFSFSDAMARYNKEHPEWSEERRMTMASREDPNMGGDVVSAKRRDGGGAPKSGKKWAGVIKNTNYTSMKVLPGVEADASRTKSEWLGEGFPTMVSQDLTGSGIEGAIDAVADHAAPGAEINLYFGGHGTNAGGLAGINAFAKFGTTGLEVSDSVDYSSIGALAGRAVSEGWHFKAIIDCCESGAVAEAVNDALVPNVESTKTTDYDVHTDEMREKGLPHVKGRYKGDKMEEILFRQFVRSSGKTGFGTIKGT
ncbi:MAG: hypothetical protein ACJAZO_000846 [Myxococcota bacterium]|jgi:hypothetical protein